MNTDKKLDRRAFIKTSALGIGFLGISGSSIANSLDDMNNESSDDKYCLLPSHGVPVIANVDLLIVGGVSAAVAAAVEATRNGLSVFLVSPFPYLGEDICGTLNLWQQNNIFGDEAAPLKPLHVKTALEDCLIESGAGFLYSSYFVDALYDKSGAISGGLIVNRSGCQAVCAKLVIDATVDATVARVCKLPMKGTVAGKQKYSFTVVGNSEKTGDHIIEIKKLSPAITIKNKTYSALRYTFEFDSAENDYAALNRIEQQIRSITWDPDQMDSSDLLAYIPSQHIDSGKSPANEDFEVELFKSAALKNLYIMSGYADVPRDKVEQFRDSSIFMRTGTMIGKDAALQAGKIAHVSMSGLNVRKRKGQTVTAKAREINSKLRPGYDKGSIRLSEIELPVLADYDLVVLGGGTSGAPTGISAARQGIKTLTLEYLHAFGGMMTAGLIGRYWDGFREGFTNEIDSGVCSMAPEDHPRRKKNCSNEWVADWKMEWFRHQTLKAGGDIWFGVIGCGAVVEGSRVRGVVVATPYGRGVILAKHVVDSTGSADIAIAAGAKYGFTDQKSVATQGAGLSRHNPDDYYNNNDWTFIDDTDILDVSRVFVAAKAKYKGEYDLCKIPQTRERRRTIAEHNVSVLDVINGRRYPDTISYHASSFDTHGFTVDPYFTLKAPKKSHVKYNADVPLRTLLPKGLEGIIVTGLGTGAHRDAMPIIRMQPCLQNQGYAVGYLVATAVKENKTVRQVDIKKVQQHLTAMGNLPKRVLTDKDNFPFSDERLKEAASTLHNDMEGLEILMTDQKRAIPLLKQHYNEKTGSPQAVNYAHILALLGDATGIKTLIDEVNSYTEWDIGWHYTGMGQFGPCMSRLDSLIMALGNTKKKEALQAVIPHANRLKAESSFSHFRSICLAFESVGDKAAAPVLYEIINSRNMRNEPVTDYKKARNAVNQDTVDTSVRNRVLKELHLARALYRCGDCNGLGKTILEEYANDLRAHYARHAESILKLD
jgi:hypothetical protein